ncbi:MAG: FAD binding domain-containing protein [bacterium]|nr:FAD binding domain-containing protein [bacterium]MDE0352252.1 FAD binding domain-containing protein [bacterium]
MKPAPFDYYRPAAIGEAVEALGSSEDAKVLAGGQSLIPSMNFRLALPDLLVDIRHVDGLDNLETGPDGVTIGAAVTQSRVMASDAAAAGAPGLRRALRLVAHLQIRNRGTVCGSLAHADPAAELPALAVASRATLTIRGPVGERTVEAGDFFLGPFWTDLGHGEIITGVHFPVEPSGTRTVVDEITRRSGDFAIVGLAAAFDLQGDTIGAARLVSFGVSGVASRMATAEEAIRGLEPGDDGSDLYAAAYEDAADAVDDIHATAEYRREALGALLVRTARSAVKSNGHGTGV